MCSMQEQSEIGCLNEMWNRANVAQEEGVQSHTETGEKEWAVVSVIAAVISENYLRLNLRGYP